MPLHLEGDAVAASIYLKPGRMIVFEGIEGCGKTTQLARTQAYLAGLGVAPLMQTREPGGSKLGLAIRALLLDQVETTIDPVAELLLFQADRAQHVSEMRSFLSGGGLILCDRYVDSTTAYQGFGRGLALDMIQAFNYTASSGLTPDLTLWLDLPVEQGLTRARKGSGANRMEAEEIDFHTRVYEGFLALYRAGGGRMRIDADGTETEVAARIQKVVDEHLNHWLRHSADVERHQRITTGQEAQNV